MAKVPQSSFLEVAKTALEETVRQLVPVEKERERLLTQKSYFEKVISDGRPIFPDVAKRIKVESVLQQYKEKQIITQVRPDRTGTVSRKPATALAARIADLFKKVKNEPLHVGELAKLLVDEKFYDDKQRAIFRVENYFTKHKEEFVKVAPRTFKPRLELATIGEAVAAKGGAGGMGHARRGVNNSLPMVDSPIGEEAATSESPAEQPSTILATGPSNSGFRIL